MKDTSPSSIKSLSVSSDSSFYISFDDLFFMCICDDGITVKESLKKVQPEIKDGREALIKALKGTSSKNKDRGWGLSTTIDIAHKGYHA